MKNKPAEIIVHHSAETAPHPQFDAIDAMHKERGFPRSASGHFVGYHYVIERDGTVRAARGHQEEGAHARGRNAASIGICLVGNFDLDLPTSAQSASLGSLLVRVAGQYGISEENIVPHRTHNADTHCYGLRLADDWARRLYRTTKK